MSKKIPEYLRYFLEDCLGGDVHFTKKNMFGGYAIYKNGKIFGLFINDIIYFKVGDNNRIDYENKHSEPFSYKKKNGVIGVMSYWELPEDIIENRDELSQWIKKSLEVEVKIKVAKKSKDDISLDREILKELLNIPKGKVSTYKILGERFNVHPRRIASVMKHNKEPEYYPCYKVISHSGKILGYSGPDGINSKITMLIEEGIDIIDGKIDKKYYYTY